MPDTPSMPPSKSIHLRPAHTAVSPFAYPLDEFYAQAGRALPAIEAVPGDSIPEPYRMLLVHNNDMTPTLAKFHGHRLHLEVLRRQQRQDFYFREVVLLLDETDHRVEFGAIKINLALFPATARRLILEERLPLGEILGLQQIPHTSRPKAFFRLKADTFITDALTLSGSPQLFGRRNTLLDLENHPLAEIVEILPPRNSNLPPI